MLAASQLGGGPQNLNGTKQSQTLVALSRGRRRSPCGANRRRLPAHSVAVLVMSLCRSELPRPLAMQQHIEELEQSRIDACGVPKIV
jgi:hypothetical protein